MMPPPPAVKVAPVEVRELAEQVELTGRTAPVEFVEVRPRVSGHIEKVHFESGQWVKQGDVLFSIDARWHKADADRREAELAMAQARFENAERDAARNARLLAGKAISREEADARDARLSEARASLQAARASRDSVLLDLEHTQVRSPIAGRVSRALVTAGNFVNGSPGGASVLTTVVSQHPIHVYADLDENSLLRFESAKRDGRLNVGGDGRIPVELQLSGESGFPWKGHLESLDNRLDPQLGSIVLRAVFPNEEGRILPGLFARLRMPVTSKASTLLVAEEAISTDQAQKFVLTLTSSNTAAYRPVKLGAMHDGKRVIREGLSAGEQVILNVVMARVRPGMPVVPVQPSGPESAKR